MRDKLNVSKTFIDSVMKRTNEFRHVDKSGNPPTPLTDDEKKEFAEKVEKVIKAYIEYLYERDELES